MPVVQKRQTVAFAKRMKSCPQFREFSAFSASELNDRRIVLSCHWSTVAKSLTETVR